LGEPGLKKEVPDVCNDRCSLSFVVVVNAGVAAVEDASVDAKFELELAALVAISVFSEWTRLSEGAPTSSSSGSSPSNLTPTGGGKGGVVVPAAGGVIEDDLLSSLGSTCEVDRKLARAEASTEVKDVAAVVAILVDLAEEDEVEGGIDGNKSRNEG
jgi:hypothetical protein